MSIVAPGLVLLIFFGIQSGLYFYGRTVAVQAAREGVSLMRLARRTTPRRVMLSPLRRGQGRGLRRERWARVAARPGRGGTGTTPTGGQVEVRVTGRVITLVPGLDLEVSEVVSGTIERFEGDR